MSAAVLAKSDRTWPIVWKWSLLAVVVFAAGVTILLPRAVLQLVLPDQTVYAAGFSEERFGQVRPGMLADQVLSLLGPPLEVVVEPADRQSYKRAWQDRPADTAGVRRWWWEYSRPGSISDSYSVRAVELSPAGKVVAVEHHYYQD